MFVTGPEIPGHLLLGLGIWPPPAVRILGPRELRTGPTSRAAPHMTPPVDA